jgi:hypothetical protein
MSVVARQKSWSWQVPKGFGGTGEKRGYRGRDKEMVKDVQLQVAMEAIDG